MTGGGWQREVHPHGALRQLDERLWIVTGSLPRSPLPRNMVVHRLDSGGLLLHSLVALDAPGMEALEALGPVELLVVPSAMHRSHAAAFARRFPDASVVCPVAAHGSVEEVVPVRASAEEALPPRGVGVHVPRGVRPGELVLEVEAGAGRALLVNDLLFHLDHLPGLSGLVLRLLRTTGRFGVTPVGRRLLRVQPRELAGFLDELSRRDGLSLLTVSHGEPLTERVAARLREAADALRGRTD